MSLAAAAFSTAGSSSAGPQRCWRSFARRSTPTLWSALGEIGDLGIIMRIDATLSHQTGPDTVMYLLHSAEEAAALGADMVVVNCYVGTGDMATESALLEKLATVSAEAERIGMPVCAEIIPRVSTTGPARKEPSSEDLAQAIRLGLEYGCDVVKTVYNGDPEGYARAVASGHIPVIMAGGPKTSGEAEFFAQVHEAMTHGACGVGIGRRTSPVNNGQGDIQDGRKADPQNVGNEEIGGRFGNPGE